MEQLEACHKFILPIWERWTDGNPAVRRLIECSSADPNTYDERFRLLLNTTAELSRHSDGVGIRAALAAASACCNAYIGVPDERFRTVCARAAALDRAARGELQG
ncbi:MAG: hypothetical protein JWO59_683 [Chloroflexi bacterium]|nr:hypothetical protein [Chloroflexota bacterium]